MGYELYDLNEFRGDPTINTQVIQPNPVLIQQTVIPVESHSGAENRNENAVEPNIGQNQGWFDWVQYGKSLRRRFSHLFE